MIADLKDVAGLDLVAELAVRPEFWFVVSGAPRLKRD
jgi:hypothetical protein